MLKAPKIDEYPKLPLKSRIPTKFPNLAAHKVPISSAYSKFQNGGLRGNERTNQGDEALPRDNKGMCP